jgi:hypothetical protein
METRPFYSVLAHLSDFYDITMEESHFENIAMHAWDHIGNKQYRLYNYHCIVENKQVTLPCNADVIEAVFADQIDFKMPDNTSTWDYSNYEIETYVDSVVRNTEAFYNKGKLADYQRVGNTLLFERTGFGVTVLYKGVITDDTGLPSLNFKEVDAIAKYCAFVELQRKAMVTKDQSTFQMALVLKQQWQFAVEDARTPLYLNQNDMDKILDVQTSWDRKRFGISFKPIR